MYWLVCELSQSTSTILMVLCSQVAAETLVEACPPNAVSTWGQHVLRMVTVLDTCTSLHACVLAMDCGGFQGPPRRSPGPPWTSKELHTTPCKHTALKARTGFQYSYQLHEGLVSRAILLERSVVWATFLAWITEDLEVLLLDPVGY